MSEEKRGLWKKRTVTLLRGSMQPQPPAKQKKGPSATPVIFTVDGIEVVLTKKKIKNINLRVKTAEGPVVVSAPLWATQETVEHFVRQKKLWIEQRQQALAQSPRVPKKEVSAEELEQWRKQIIPATEALVHMWEPIMGVKAGRLAYRNMTSRWGSCNPKTGRICINLQLANYPEECLEYLVVHELCHLLEKGHGPRFKALMTQYLPDWQARRKLLR